MEIKKEIKISEVLSLLDEGKSREEIAQHFELSNGDLAVLFKHPSLKGKKAKKQRDFIVVDDTQEITTSSIANEVSNTGTISSIEQEEVENNTEEVANTPWVN